MLALTTLAAGSLVRLHGTRGWDLFPRTAGLDVNRSLLNLNYFYMCGCEQRFGWSRRQHVYVNKLRWLWCTSRKPGGSHPISGNSGSLHLTRDVTPKRCQSCRNLVRLELFLFSFLGALFPGTRQFM